MTFLFWLYSQNRIKLFSCIVLANLLIVWLSRSFIIDEAVFYNTFSEQLTYSRALVLFENMKRMAWLTYAFTPFILLVRTTLISIVIYTGVFFNNRDDRITFRLVFRIVVASEMIFVCASFIKFLWFLLVAGNYDMNDISFFYPLSLINLFSIDEVERFWIFPMQSVNMFQVIYILLLSYGLSAIGKIERSVSEKIVLSSYLPALGIWIALVMFLTIDLAL